MRSYNDDDDSNKLLHSNGREPHIAAEHRSFNRIRQVVPIRISLWLLGQARVCPPNGTPIGSEAFARLVALASSRLSLALYLAFSMGRINVLSPEMILISRVARY